MQDQDDRASGKREAGGASDFPDEQIKREIAERLRHALKLAGGPSKVSASSGISLRTIANYTSERSELKASALVRLAEACDVSLDWLATGTPPVHRLDRLAQFEADAGEAVVPLPTRMAADLGDEYVLVPRYDVRASAGGGAVVHSEQVVDHLAFKAEWVRNRLGINPVHLLLLEAVGDSMEPTISDGDLLLVSTHEPRIRDNAIYALNVAGDLMVKRVQKRLDGTLVVSSDNPRYRPEEVAPRDSDMLRVIGQVLWHGGLI